MKKEIFVVCIVGLFLASSLLGTTAGKPMNDDCEVGNYQKNDEYSLTYVENKVDVGTTWTVNEGDILTGTANLEIENMSVDWIVEPQADGSFGEVARGMVNMDVFKFCFEDENSNGNALPLPLFDRYSNYELSVYDGESTDDNVLLQDSVPFVGGGIEFTSLSSLLTVDTNNKPSRTLAFKATAQTQTYSPVFRFSFEGAAGLESKVGHMIINFMSPYEAAYKDEIITDPPKQLEVSDTVDFDAGSIRIYTSHPNTGIPATDIDMNRRETIKVNHSEDVTVNAHLDWEITLTDRPHSRLLSFLPCEIIMRFRAMSTNIQGKSETISGARAEYTHLCIENAFQDNGTITMSFTVNTGEYPLGVKFLLSYFLVISPLGVQPNDKEASNSGVSYIFWDTS